METLIGHTKHLNYFQKLADAGTLHHAYALLGPDHIGKKTLAEHIIASLLHTSIHKLPIHPDFLHIDRMDEEGKLKRDITVEHIESVTSKASRSPIAGPYNVVLIEDADKMNPYAGNSLLKTLEEPATPTFFFLLASSEEKLLPTIQSRVHTISLSRIPIDQLQSELQAHFPKEKNLEEIVRISGGLPGLVVDWIQNPESFEAYKLEVNRFFSLFHKPFFEKLAIVEPLFGDKKAHIEGRQELTEILHIWVNCIHLGVKENTFPQIPSGAVVPMYDIIMETIAGLGQNVHPRLSIENLLLILP